MDKCIILLFYQKESRKENYSKTQPIIRDETMLDLSRLEGRIF